MDAKSGEKFQTEELEKTADASARSSDASPLALPSGTSLPGSGQAPPSQGFVNEWLNLYPSNRMQAEFRYLGQEKLDRRQTLVVAFAQKPGLVRIPAVVTYHEKPYKTFRQGVVWVDATDFRIVRLRTDILSPPPGVPLRQLTADTQFAEVRVAEIASPLWLPRQVVVTSNFAGLDPPREPLLFTLPVVSHEIEAAAESVGFLRRPQHRDSCRERTPRAPPSSRSHFRALLRFL